MLHKRLLLFAVLALFLGSVGYFLLPPALANSLYQRIAYPVILLHWALLGVVIWKCQWFRPATLKAVMLPGQRLLLILFLACGTLFTVHHRCEFKTLGDEALVASVAQNLHLNRSPEYIWRAYSIDGSFSVVEAKPEKRPIGFAVLLSVVHDLTGYRVENGFYLNLVLGWLMLALLAWLGNFLAGRWGAAAGLVLVPSIPMISYYAHGSGIDHPMMVMILVVLCLGLQWARTDRDPMSLLAYLYAAVLLSVIRYEAFLFLGPVALSILIVKWRDREWDLPWGTFTTLPMLLLIPLQQAAFRINESFWELEMRPEATTVFSLNYLFDNLGRAVLFFFDTSNVFPNSPVVSALAAVAFIGMLLALMRTIRSRQVVSGEQWVLFLMCVGMLAHFALIMVYFYGQIDSLMLHRFSLPFCLFLLIACIWPLRHLSSTLAKTAWLGALVLGLVFYSIPTAATHAYEDRYFPATHASWVKAFVNAHDTHPYMVVDFNPLLWTTRSVSAIPYTRANLSKSRIHYQLTEGALRTIYVIEAHTRDEKTGRFVHTTDASLDPAFELKTLSSEFINPSLRMVLKQIVGVAMPVVGEGDETKGSGDEGSVRKELNHEQLYYLNLP